MRYLKYFLKYATAERVKNLALLQLSKFSKHARVKGKPVIIMIEPTNICNLHCPLCPTGAGLLKRKKGHMSFDTFKKIIDEVATTAFRIRLWNWGEPLLNKDFVKMIKYAKSKNLFVNTSTNSFFLNEKIAQKLVESGLDELIVSLDGASEETYNKYRKNGSFLQVVKSLRTLREEKIKAKRKTPSVRLQFVIMKHNEHEIPKIKKLAKEVNVDALVFKTVGIMDPSMSDKIKEFIPSEKLSRYVLKEKAKSKQKIRNWCDIMYNEVVINWDGSVVPCCYDMHNTFTFGNILDQPFSKIWNNKKYQDFRKQILNNKKSIFMCKNCPGNTKEILLKL